MARWAMDVSWSRILIESGAVVLSILLAFGIDAWWGARGERAREEAYLTLLVSDLQTTLGAIEGSGGIADNLDPAAARLVQAYYSPDLLDLDSLTSWFDAAFARPVAQPRVGTAEALIASGDLALIRSDSLKAAVTEYLTVIRFFDGQQRQRQDAIEASRQELSLLLDLPQVRFALTSVQTRDSIAAADPLAAFPAGPVRQLPRLELEDIVRSPRVHSILFDVLEAKRTNGFWRDQMRQRTQRMLEQVEAYRRSKS